MEIEDSMLTFIMLAGGLVILTAGAELLVRSASALAVAARVSPLVIGLTVVAYGTSAPELVVSLQAVLRGQSDIALGNVVGSNNFNVLLILGLSALIVPLKVSQQLIRFEVPLLIVLAFLVTGMSWNGRVERGEGLALVAGLVAYTVWGIFQSRKEQQTVEREDAADVGSPPVRAMSGRQILQNVVLVVAGLLLLVGGSRWFTDAAITVARALGLSELVIGLTIVAAGTSLPEVATSVMAAFRGERDIAVGNVVGSNLFNLLGVLGLSSLVSASGVGVPDVALSFDLPVMIAVSVACLPIFFTGGLISRGEGALFLFYFVAYSAYLIAAESRPDVTRTLTSVMVGIVIPLTVITLSVTFYRARGQLRDVPVSSDR